MKSHVLSQLFCLTASLLSSHYALARPSLAIDWVDSDLAEFEMRYLDTLNYEHSNKTVKLIGYKKIHIPSPDREEFEGHYFAKQAEWREKLPNAYYDKGTTTLRMYFPVAAALVEHHGQMVEASSLGEFEFDELNGDCAVLGRKQTDSITGVEGNVIKDGIIYLAERNKPHHQHGKVYVYDFGIKVVHDHDPHSSHHHKRDGKVGCMNNHGGPNCSDKFGIHNGRCPFRKDHCVDYNGYWTDCKKGGWNKPIKFPGSDCSFALARGHCWNELM